MKIRYTTEAHRDLLSALEHISRDEPAAAARLDDRMLAMIERLAAGDFEGRQTTLTTGEVVRSWPVNPFRIYSESGEMVGSEVARAV